MARFTILIWLLCGAALCAAQAPASGRYGTDLSIAGDAELLTGWLDRSESMPQCRLYLRAKLVGPRWRLQVYSVATGDLITGAIEVTENTLRWVLPRAPRGCEQQYQGFVDPPTYRLRQPRKWQSIALIRASGAQILDRADPEAKVMAQLAADEAWAVTEVRRGYSAGMSLKPEGGEAGWVRSRALAPSLANAAMRERDARLLPGLSAPATLAEREGWRQLLDWSSECEARFRSNRSRDGGLTLIQVAPQFALLRIDCGPMSYQESFVYAWIRLGAPEQTRLLLFPGFSADRGESRVSSDHSVVFGLDEVDPTAQTLLLFSKWRSPGDCGQLLRFDLRVTGPELTEWRERSCEEEPLEEPLSPLEWPLKEVGEDA